MNIIKNEVRAAKMELSVIVIWNLVILIAAGITMNFVDEAFFRWVFFISIYTCISSILPARIGWNAMTVVGKEINAEQQEKEDSPAHVTGESA